MFQLLGAPAVEVAEFLVDVIGFNKVQGVPIFADELAAEIATILGRAT